MARGEAWDTAAMRALDARLLRGWPPARCVELHGWRCGLDGGVTRRPNSVWPLAWRGDLLLDAAITQAEALYRDAGLAPCFRITEGAAPAALDAALAARGYTVEGRSHVLVAPVAALPAGRRGTLELSLLAAPSEAWLACYAADHGDAAARTALAALARRIAAPRRFAGAVVDGTLASVALVAVTEDWAQVSAVRTLAEYRRRGLAAAVLEALLGWARRQGAQRCALQVEAENAPVLALYGKAGFRRAYDYFYRARR
jgi:GNAT superfamily N-acetyltransferase